MADLNRRGSNRVKGAPALPGAGRPPRSTVLRIGDGIAIKYAMEGGSTPFKLGEVAEITRGIPRTTVIKLRNGDTIYLLAETPRDMSQGEGEGDDNAYRNRKQRRSG